MLYQTSLSKVFFSKYWDPYIRKSWFSRINLSLENHCGIKPILLCLRLTLIKSLPYFELQVMFIIKLLKIKKLEKANSQSRFAMLYYTSCIAKSNKKSPKSLAFISYLCLSNSIPGTKDTTFGSFISSS